MTGSALIESLEEGLRSTHYLESFEPAAIGGSPPLRGPSPTEETTSRWIRSPLPDVQRGLERAGSQSAKAASLGRKLRLVLAMLDEVPFDTSAKLISVPQSRLVAWLHGREPVRPGVERRLDALALILRSLHEVVEPSVTDEWLRAPIPALGGLTPLEAILKGKINRVAQVTKSYVDPSFS